MKKKLFTLFLLVLTGLCALPAQGLTGNQQKAKMEIFKYLQKSARNVQDAGKGDIKFEADGIHFDVHVKPEGINPLYLIISATFTVPEEYQQDLLFEAGLEAANNKPVYVNTYKNIILFDCEMYAENAKPFIQVLPAMINAIKESANSFETEYQKLHSKYQAHNHSNSTANHQDQPSSSTFESVSSLFASDAQEYDFPVCQNTGKGQLYVSKVIRKNNETILEFISYNHRQYQYCSINKHAYLLANGKKYALMHADGINYTPKSTDFPNWQSRKNVSLTFRLHFPALPQSVKQFDFSEGQSEGWEIKNIHLDASGILPVSGGENIVTSDHRWRVVSVQVTPQQTVVKKAVTPTTAGTYMYSSQSEYIQDAETGQKYYLQNSSLGFEGNPSISFDTNERIFCEVYPALPASVKRIHISSEDQYYIQNMTIR